MIPLRRFAAPVVLLAAFAVACSSGGSLVATVGGDTEITLDDVADLYEGGAVPKDEGLQNAVFALVAKAVLIDGMEADFAVVLDEALIDETYAAIIADMEARGVTPETYLGVPKAGRGMLRFNAEIGVLRDQVVAALVSDPTTIDDLFASPALITTVCASHILVETEEEALAVIGRLEAGEEFSAVADELSTDTSPGGDLGCNLASRYVLEFANAAVETELDEVTGPVETEFGWHVILVTDRSVFTREQVEADPLAFFPAEVGDAMWSDWFNLKLQEADVVVEAEYGTWSPLGITPPTE